jgi:hypothetical protein
MFKNLVKFSNYLSNLWTNISGIKQIVYQPKIFGIRSLFISFYLIQHQIVGTETNTASVKSFIVWAWKENYYYDFEMWDEKEGENEVFDAKAKKTGMSRAQPNLTKSFYGRKLRAGPHKPF